MLVFVLGWAFFYSDRLQNSKWDICKSDNIWCSSKQKIVTIISSVLIIHTLMTSSCWTFPIRRIWFLYYSNFTYSLQSSVYLLQGFQYLLEDPVRGRATSSLGFLLDDLTADHRLLDGRYGRKNDALTDSWLSGVLDGTFADSWGNVAFGWRDVYPIGEKVHDRWGIWAVIGPKACSSILVAWLHADAH